jgi:cytochrome c-type biogenesis protein CcmH
MTTFLIIATLMTAAALLFVLPPLLREGIAGRWAGRDAANLAVLRDQMRELDADLAAGSIDVGGHAVAREELAARVADEVRPSGAGSQGRSARRWTALLLAVAIPLGAAALYRTLGTPDALDPALLVQANDPNHDVSDAQLGALVVSLAERLKAKPDDVDGWNMLARSYGTLGRFGDAATAYAHVVALVPDDADTLADYADVLAMSLNKSMQGAPEKLIMRALQLDPNNVKSLALAGSAAFERNDYAGAVVYWKKVLALVPPESEMARTTMSSIGEAQGRASEPAGAPAAGDALAPAPQAAPLAGAFDNAQATLQAAPPAPPAPIAAATAPAAAAAATVSGTVDIDAALRAGLADTDTVFIYARAVNGPPFPLAALRKQVRDLPVRFVLDDSMSMMPTAKLSGFPLVVVGARISKSGSATPAAGDLEGVSAQVRPGASDLVIRINARRK